MIEILLGALLLGGVPTLIGWLLPKLSEETEFTGLYFFDGWIWLLMATFVGLVVFIVGYMCYILGDTILHP